MNDDDIAWLDMAEIAQLIRSRKMSAVEVAQAQLRRIERLDGDAWVSAHPRCLPALRLAESLHAAAMS